MSSIFSYVEISVSMVETTDIVTRQDKPFISRNYNDRVNISKIKLKRYREDLLSVGMVETTESGLLCTVVSI